MKVKINKKLLLFTSILILLSSLVGCVFWYQLPEKMPTHFNLLGQADGYNHKVFAIFGLPALMLLMHWLLLFLMIKDPKSSNISSKIQVLIYWIIPFVSCLSMISILSINDFYLRRIFGVFHDEWTTSSDFYGSLDDRNWKLSTKNTQKLYNRYSTSVDLGE